MSSASFLLGPIGNFLLRFLDRTTTMRSGVRLRSESSRSMLRYCLNPQRNNSTNKAALLPYYRASLVRVFRRSLWEVYLIASCLLSLSTSVIFRLKIDPNRLLQMSKCSIYYNAFHAKCSQPGSSNSISVKSLQTSTYSPCSERISPNAWAP